jgi:peptidylprolyl isomerase
MCLSIIFLIMAGYRVFITTTLATFVVLSVISLVGVVFAKNVTIDKKTKKELENIINIKTIHGDIKIRLFPDFAPKHVSRIKELANKGFYNGLLFHRVIDKFVAQLGGKEGDLNHGSGKNIKFEKSTKNHIRGAVSMARGADKNSADSQFFIVLEDSPFLDGEYVVFGFVVDGMDVVDKIKKGSRYNNGIVENPDRIISMSMAIDEEMKKAVNK